jgi:peptidyl-prolyl cis-trans isomerase A (cyclophilin A)
MAGPTRSRCHAQRPANDEGMIRFAFALAVCLIGLLLNIGCVANPTSFGQWDDADDAPRPVPHPRVLVQTSRGDLLLELDRERAPVSTNNFLMHARLGRYDGTIIHRIVPGFVIQGGGWTPEFVERAKLDAADGRPDTPIINEWRNGLVNIRGTIGMAREEAPDSATREWYINLADNDRLSTAREKTGNGGYAVFGKVIAGMEIADAIAGMATSPRIIPGVTDGSMDNAPIEPIIIQSVVRITESRARAWMTGERR